MFKWRKEWQRQKLYFINKLEFERNFIDNKNEMEKEKNIIIEVNIHLL